MSYQSSSEPLVANDEENGERKIIEITHIRSSTLGDLRDLAENLNISNYTGLQKKDLIPRIERALVDQNERLEGSGVLEILSEGYGFLRSQESNYLSGPNDIYVSPSQI
ncbi:MAG: Rho termination factor N-terminal domain-containing protein, partial [bacterium]